MKCLDCCYYGIECGRTDPHGEPCELFEPSMLRKDLDALIAVVSCAVGMAAMLGILLLLEMLSK